ncbi:putative chromosome segregation protein [Erysiphe neolycopersici]|uniref:Putative chromosome segregation protein n=1 Tax=Erysiphe neolycopersici TaxID=212602 RepID=A0A420HVM5_9PEZI|nr:putative chromosome segregation protein [Erysiphe neolycopersici]
MSQEHASVSMENLFEAFNRTWPNLFPEGTDPSLLVQKIATESESPEKQMFCILLNCFEYQFGILNEKILSQEGEFSELDSGLNRARSQINDLHNTVSLNKRQIENLEESAKNNMTA